MTSVLVASQSSCFLRSREQIRQVENRLYAVKVRVDDNSMLCHVYAYDMKSNAHEQIDIFALENVVKTAHAQ